MLALLRQRLGRQLDAPDMPPAALAAVTRKFMDVDARVRALDAAAVELANAPADDDDDDEGGGTVAWDPAKV